jgi:hypothetical protein
MSIDKDILDRLMEDHAPTDLFGKDGILSTVPVNDLQYFNAGCLRIRS